MKFMYFDIIFRCDTYILKCINTFLYAAEQCIIFYTKI